MRNAIFFCALVSAGPAIAQTAPAPAQAPAPAATTTPAPGVAPATAAPTGAAPAASATTAQLQAGATIYDNTGAVVGTVDQIAGDVVTVNTGANKVGVPKGNFAPGPNGFVLGNTKAQLDAAAGQAAAQSQAQVKSLLVAGAQVRGSAGTVLGTVKSADDQFATLTAKGGDVRLPVSGFAAGPNGLVIGMTAAQFDAAVSASKPK